MGAPRRWVRLASRLRADVPMALIDAALVTAATVSLLAVRFEGSIPDGYWSRLSGYLPIVIAVHLTANLAWGLYGPIWRHASVAEARRIAFAGLTAGSVIFLINPDGEVMPRSVALFGAFLAMMLMAGARFQVRLWARRPVAGRSATRVAIVGAGEAGAAIVRDLRRLPDNDRLPVVIVDDDRRKQGRSLLGVPVVADTQALAHIAHEYQADEVLMAIPSADQQVVRSVMQGAELAGVPLKVLPPVRELLGANPSVRDVRDLQIEDLLGRAQVATDIDSIRATVGHSTVLITGAGGSIGSEIAKQVSELAPARLLLLDHDETHLHDARTWVTGPVDLVLADIRDRDRMAELMHAVRPDMVFHAAAHKHVPLLEAHPAEAVRTNVLGTRNVVEAAASAGVGRLVFISSDKAVRPQNVLGYSKWLGEQFVLHTAPPGTRWCSVRFGNVLGSRGSVIPTFAHQIAAGGPLTVTDPRMTRFFMSVREAVQLVLQSSTMSLGGEIFMLDMGEAVNILELAERMVRLSGRQVGSEIPIRFTGRRAGEKLAEDLQNPEEYASPTAHPSIVGLAPTKVDATFLDNGTQRLEELVARRLDRDAASVMVALADAAHSSGGHNGAGLPQRREPWSPLTT
jgi:FlaA1/EpsC-like NDP-sugar epimerase